MTTDATAWFAGNRGKAALWAGVLLPPAAWILHLTAAFTLATRLCDGRHHWLLHALLPAALAIAGVGGVLAWRSWRRLGGGFEVERTGVLGRSAFLAVAGLASAAFFGLVILLSEIPNLFLPPCLKG